MRGAPDISPLQPLAISNKMMRNLKHMKGQEQRLLDQVRSKSLSTDSQEQGNSYSAS